MSGVTGSAGLLVRMIGQLAQSAQEDRKDAAKDASDASQHEIESMIEGADKKKLAAKEDYYIQNLEGTIGVIPVAGKLATTVMTSGKQEQEFMGGVAATAGLGSPIMMPIGMALLSTSQLRPQLRAANEANAAAGKSDPKTDNSLVNTFAFADREDRDVNKDLANRADIDAKRAGKAGSEAKSTLDDAKKSFQDTIQNMRTILDDQKRASDKIQG